MALAWATAKLMRAKTMPPLSDLLPRAPVDPETAAAEMRASMAVYRTIAAERGQIRSWQEWQT